MITENDITNPAVITEIPQANTFAAFKRNAPGCRCKLIKSESEYAATAPVPGWFNHTATHATANVIRLIKAVRAHEIVFILPDGRASYAIMTSASEYSATPTGFILEQRIQGPAVIGIRLTYEWVRQITI